MVETLNIRLPLIVDGLVIRRISPKDFDDLQEYCTDPEVSRYQLWGPYSSEEVAALIDEQLNIEPGDPGVGFILAAECDHKIIGHCHLNLTSPEDRQADVGFTFNPRFTGRGFATSTVRAVLGFGFNQLGIHRIIGATDVRNERSWRLMERIGMRKEAHFIHDCFVKEEWRNTYLYSMLDEEWKQRYFELEGLVSFKS